MKTKILSAVLFILIAVKANAFGGGHDSLLFDGSQEVITKMVFDNDCILKVKHVKGRVHGTKYMMKSITGDCLTKEVKEMGTTQALLKHEDVLVVGTDIWTEADSYVYVDLADGSQMVIGPNSMVKIEEGWCVERNFFLRGGTMWSKVKKLLGADEFQVGEGRSIVGVRGTEFEMESADTSTTVKVYEGVVEVEQLGTGDTKNMADLGKEMEKLTQDFQAGKITMEEFTAKMKELEKSSQSGSKDNLKKSVNAGYMVILTNTALMGEPVPITGSNRWWENVQWDPDDK